MYEKLAHVSTQAGHILGCSNKDSIENFRERLTEFERQMRVNRCIVNELSPRIPIALPTPERLPRNSVTFLGKTLNFQRRRYVVAM